jgi:hypothetical protein
MCDEVFTVLTVVISANDWHFIDGSSHLKTVGVANRLSVGL